LEFLAVISTKLCVILYVEDKVRIVCHYNALCLFIAK